MNVFFSAFSLLVFSCFLSNICIAQSPPQYSIGILASYSSSIYNQTSDNEIAFPFASYESESFFIKQANIGYHLLENIDVAISYKGDFFDPDDSSNTDMQLLNIRKEGFYAKGSAKAGVFNATIEQDISGRHDGFLASGGINLPLFYNPKIPLIVRASITYSYTNKKMSEYLYSVSTSESTLTNGRIPTYTLESANSTKYGILAIFPLSKQFSFVSIFNYTDYSDEVTASPIVSKNHNYSATMIATYKL